MNSIILRYGVGPCALACLIGLIAIGTLLLACPFCQVTSFALIDIFTTATSCVTTTGLMTVPLQNFSPIGQGIMLMLIQLGGLLIVTLTLAALSALLSTQKYYPFWQTIKRIIYATICIELVCAGIIYTIIKADYAIGRGLFVALFHAVSSLCNTGFTLFDDGMISYQANYPMLMITMLLMLIGDIGFFTWFDLIKKVRHSLPLSVHSRIVLQTTVVIIACGTLLFIGLEKIPLISALFNAISIKGTGFLTMRLHSLTNATLFGIMIIALIGTSPGSTGGGIKTTSCALILATVTAIITGRRTITLGGKRMSTDQITKAFTILVLSLIWISFILFLLLASQQQSFLTLAFETVSAFSNLGQSFQTDPYSMTLANKIALMGSMIIGKLGTVSIALTLHHMDSQKTELQQEVMVL